MPQSIDEFLSSSKQKKGGLQSIDEFLNPPEPSYPIGDLIAQGKLPPFSAADSELSRQAELFAQQPPQPQPEAQPERPGRDLPVIGPAFRVLDTFGEKIEPIVAVPRSFYTPGAGLANVAGFAGAAEAGIAKLLPKFGSTLGGRVAQTAVREAITGAPLGTGQYLASGGNETGEALESGLYGAVLGGVLGGAGKAIGEGAKAIGDKFAIGDKLAFRQSINDFIAKTQQPRGPEDFVTHPSETLTQQAGGAKPANVGDQLAENFNRGETYQKEFEQAVQDQYDFLKQSMANKGGVDQGALLRDPTTGEVIDRIGRISNNPPWYQEFFDQHGRTPTNKDLRELAEQQVKQGFQDSGGRIPSFKPNELQQLDSEIADIQATIPHIEGDVKTGLQQELERLRGERERMAGVLPEGVQAMQVKKPLPPLSDNYVKPLSHYSNTLYRETSPEQALDLLPGSNVFTDTKGDLVYFSNTKDLALGQGNNKGVMIEFDSGNIQGQVNRQKPTWEMAYKNGDAEFIGKLNSQKTYQDAVKSVTISPDAKVDKVTKVRLQRTLSNWEKVKNPDGSVTYFPPGKEPVQAMHVKGDSAPVEPIRRNESTTATASPPVQSSPSVQAMRAHPIPLRPANPNAVIKKPITRQQLTDNVRKRHNIPIRRGRLGTGDQDVLGVYKIRPEVIRTRAGEMQELTHELGHHYDKQLNLANPQYDRELMQLGQHTSGPNYTLDMVRAEGVAEFMRLYLTDPATAQQIAPRYMQYFESKLTPKLKKAFEADQRDINTWIDQGPAMQFRGQINRTGKEARKSAAEKVDEAYTDFVDKLHPLSVVEKAANLIQTGKSVLSDAAQSLYKKARLYAGTPKKAYLLLQDMKRILKPIDKFGYTMTDVGDYIAARHALELEEAGKRAVREAVQEARANGTKLSFEDIRRIERENRIESGFTKERIQSILKKYDTPEMRMIQKQLVTYNNNLLDMLVKGQILSQEAADAMRRKYPDYVPFYRFFDEDMESGFGGKGFADLTNPVKRLKGSKRDPIDPLESMIKNTFAVVNAVEKNKVGLELSRLADVSGMGRYVERLEGNTSVQGENIVTVFQNGERVQYQLDPELYRAMKQLDEDTVNKVIQFLSYPSSILRAGATLTPEFMLRNPIRDQFQAYVVSNFGYNPIIDLPLGLFHVIGRTNMYKQWIMEGGGYGEYLSQDRNYLREQLKKLKDERNPWAKATLAIVSPRQWKNLLQTLSEVSEEATKVGEFRRGIKKGYSPQEAAYQSRDLMDFGRVGNNIKQVNRVVTFLNANLQGKDRLARAFMAKPLRTTLRALNAVTIPAVGAYMWNKWQANEKQQETLANAPQWLRNQFFLIAIPGTDVVARIPKPYELAPVFANLPEEIMRWADHNQPQSAADFAKGAGIDLFKIPFMLAGLTPLIENATNYSFFTGGPIVPQRDQDLLPQDQYGVNTSLTARAAGKMTGTSPYKVDNLIRGYGAGLGKYATAGTDFALEKAHFAKVPPEAEKKISELPVINAFTVDDSGGGKVMDDFYKQLDKVTKQTQSNKKNQTNDAEVAAAYHGMNTASRQISKLREQYRQTQQNFDLSPTEKRRKLDEINGKMNDIARGALGKYKEKR